MLPADVMRQIRRLQLRARRAVRPCSAASTTPRSRAPACRSRRSASTSPATTCAASTGTSPPASATPFIKRFVEERELTIILAVDVSASQRFGTGGQPKRAVAAELAALRRLLRRRQQRPRRAARLHRPRSSGTCRRTRGRGTSCGCSATSSLRAEAPGHRPRPPALDYLNKAQRRRAIVFFLSATSWRPRLRRPRSAGRARKHDLIAVRTGDPREEAWPAVGLVRLEDAETGRQVLVDTGGRRFREAFAAAGGRAAGGVREAARGRRRRT